MLNDYAAASIGYIDSVCFFINAAPEDYNAVTTTLTFDATNSRRCVEFTGFEDDVVDPNENFTVTLTGGNDVELEPDMTTVLIVDEVGKSLVIVWISGFTMLGLILQCCSLVLWSESTTL